MAEHSAKICFSDIDGTIVHYPKLPQQAAELTGDIIYLVQSQTGKTGVISKATLEKAAHLRRHGVLFAIITGARTSTLMQRLPYLPAADAFESENGGRIFYPDPDGLSACSLKEDGEWRAAFEAVAGPASQDPLPPEERQGALWEWYRQLKSEGWNLDSNAYSTAFRVTKTAGKSTEELAEAIRRSPACLACTFNVGVADFYPATSGKELAAQYLMQRFGVTAPMTHSAFLCDDDNDLALAAMVGRAFVPSIGSESMAKAVKAHPERFTVADTVWCGGSEQMLDAVAAFLGLPPSGTSQAAGGATDGEEAVAKRARTESDL